MEESIAGEDSKLAGMCSELGGTNFTNGKMKFWWNLGVEKVRNRNNCRIPWNSGRISQPSMTTLIPTAISWLFMISTCAEVVAHSTWECHYGIWCVLSHTWILFLSSRYKDPVQPYIVAYISNKLFSKLQQLARYVSRHYAVAYDTYPHKWSYQSWLSCRKN